MSVFKYKGYDINYIVDGDLSDNKEIIVLLNGIMMSTQSWEIFKKPLSKNNTLIRFDMLDQGSSSKLDFEYTQEVQVDVLRELLSYLNIDKVNIVGISYGASVALQYSVKYPDTINKMVIANGVSKTSSWLKAIGDGWNKVAESRDGEAYYNITIPYIYSPKFYIENIEWMENRKEALIPIFSSEEFLDAMTRLTKSAETHNVDKYLNNIRINTLIIASKDDCLTPISEQKFLNDCIPNSELIAIPNCGHASMYERPLLFTSIILGFINNSKINYKI